MKPELQIAIANAEQVLRQCVWHAENVSLRPDDLRQLLNAAKPKPVGITVPKPEEPHPNIGIKTFTPPAEHGDALGPVDVTDQLCQRRRP